MGVTLPAHAVAQSLRRGKPPACLLGWTSEKFFETNMERVPTVTGTTNLIDILDRVLDKGLVIAGDVRIALANVELLTIRIRLLVCSVDKAEQIGLNWWKHDPNLSLPLPAVTTPGRLAAVSTQPVASRAPRQARRKR